MLKAQLAGAVSVLKKGGDGYLVELGVGLQNDLGDTVDEPPLWVSDGGDWAGLGVRLENGLVDTVGTPSMEEYFGGGELVQLCVGLENGMSGLVSVTHSLALVHLLFPSPFFLLSLQS